MWEFGSRRVKYGHGGNILLIPAADIRPSPDQTRRDFDYGRLLELAGSLMEDGFLHPLVVTFRDDVPVLVSGERRLRAAKIAGLSHVPCVERRTEPRGAALLTLIENIQREDLNCFEEAEGIDRLIAQYHLTQEEAARRLSLAQPTVANKLRLLRLTEEERRRILDSDLTERHARALLRIPNAAQRAAALNKIIEEGMSCTTADRYIGELLGAKARHPKPVPLVRDVRLFFNTVNHALDTMRRSGIQAVSEKKETEEYIEYVVRIPKAVSKTA